MTRTRALEHEIGRLLAGEHHDPHSLLGRHVDGEQAIVRVLAPNATRVSLVAGTGNVALTADGNGLFSYSGPSSDVPDEYFLEISNGEVSRVVADAYRFQPTLGELDLHLLAEGTHRELGRSLGARPLTVDGVTGVAFSVWAPSARAVSVTGDFDHWDARAHPMRSLGASGVWELFVPDAEIGHAYKYRVVGADGVVRWKADPVARASEVPPRTASIVYEAHYAWNDGDWMQRRRTAQPWREPVSIYELHAGSWRPGLDYRTLAHELADYVIDLGFTHVELMPIMEHPFAGSWGYQVTGFFAPTSRFGSPDEFREFVDILHQRGIGVILDWVPAHFPRDEWALAWFDGTGLYEHADPRRGGHPDWGTLLFNYGRREVRNFLIASGLSWLRDFHTDGLRVDAVASMIYLDYSRAAGEWEPNAMGGREDLDALAFLRELNDVVHAAEPGVLSVAEESTAWPGVTARTDAGGLGFGFKWNMGWMHDTLAYFAREPAHRRYHHNDITFSMVYAASENFVLPLSHDEVVHGKRSLLEKMPGDLWQQFANLRALYGYMWAHPGKKLLFMGGEIGQRGEWNHDASLEWHLLEYPEHAGLQKLVRDLNHTYRSFPALWEIDTDPSGFTWLVGDDADHNVLAFARWSASGDVVVCAANLSPVPRDGYLLPLPHAGQWREVLNTDSRFYGGSDVGNGGGVTATEYSGRTAAPVALPPLGVVWLVPAVSAEAATS